MTHRSRRAAKLQKLFIHIRLATGKKENRPVKT
jgi:hypothetical protein